MRRRHVRGFTLLELLLAVGIFSIVAALAYGGLRSVLDVKQQTDRSAARLSELQKGLLMFERDLAQAVVRRVRDQFGDFKHPLAGGEDVLEFSRAGWNNPAGQTRSTLQRVSYGMSEGSLVRLSWGMMDLAQDMEPYRAVLFGRVKALTLRYMGADRQWVSDWPPPEATADDAVPVGLPRAVELTLELEDWGQLQRVVLLPGN